MRPLIAALVCLALSATPEAQEPRDLGTTERSTVRLVLLDVVVVDRDGRTVPDLTAADFEIASGGPPVAIDTLDVDCSAGALDEPRAVARAGNRAPPAAAATGHTIVLAFDYMHMSPLQRELALEQAGDLVRAGGTGRDDVMVAALTGGLRVEQALTDDHREVLGSLSRMQYDISLWNGNFSHINEYGFVDGMSALLEVAGTVPGPKAVVLFSAMTDVPMDLQFRQLAGLAASTRCSIYPVDAGGLRELRPASAGGGRIIEEAAEALPG